MNREKILRQMFHDENFQEIIQDGGMAETVKRFDDLVMENELDPEIANELYNVAIDAQLKFFILGYDLALCLTNPGK